MVERVARKLYSDEIGDGWERISCGYQDVWRDHARTLLIERQVETGYIDEALE